MVALFKLSGVFLGWIVSSLIIRPIAILANAAMLAIAGLLLLALYVSASPDGYLFSLVRSWALGAWFQVSRNLLAYLPEWLAMRLTRAWSSSMDKARARHSYILGMSGSGKSVTMEMFLYRDVRMGNGIALIEPHGELADRFLHFDLFRLDHRSRAHERLVLFDLESETPTPFNIFRVSLPADPIKRHIRIDELAASYLPAFTMAISPELTEGMAAMLKSVITAVFHLPDPSFIDLINILDDEEQLETRYWRLFESLENPILRGYFEKDFFRKGAALTKAPLKDRLRGLIRSRQIQQSFLAKENAVDFDTIMREGKILVVRARKTVLGEDASRMVGNLVHQMLYAAAFRRLSLGRRLTPFFCYMDECQNYINETVIDGLSEARKFGFHYVLANQYLNQKMTLTQQKALLNCNVKICGNVTHEDAVKMAKEMGLRDDRNRFRWLRPGEFFVHIKGTLPRFVRWPSTFALPSSRVGRCRHAVYMLEKDFRALTARLRKAIEAGCSQSEIVKKFKYLDEAAETCYNVEVTNKYKMGAIQQLDASRFKIREI